MQPLAADGWRLWHPFDPTRAEAALADLERITARTVVWLNEAQHYLGDLQAGERIAAALHALLTDSGRAPVLVLGTLWPEYADQYTALPRPGKRDPHSRARELLAARTLSVPETFDRDALACAEALATGGDRFLADALSRADSHGRLAQDLAGAPELLRRYEHGSPAVRALLETAMDARRLGVGLYLPQAFLTDAAADYLSDQDWDQLGDDWAEAAYADLARPVHGKQAPLRRSNPRPARRPPGQPTPVVGAGTSEAASAGPVFLLADYLEQHGRTTRRRLCPPASFWHAAHAHLARPDDLNRLADAAERRHRLQWAHHFRQRAADAGHPGALFELARVRAGAGDWEGTEVYARRAADAGRPDALVELAWMRERAGDWEGAEAYARPAADTGHPYALAVLARVRAEMGDWEGAEVYAWRAVDADHPNALADLAEMREKAGDREGAEAYARQATEAGYFGTLSELAGMREWAGGWEGAEAYARRAADAAGPGVLVELAWMRERAGDWEGAETYARQAADAGDLGALAMLARVRARTGDWEGAEALAQRAADAGNRGALSELARMREQAGDWEGAETYARQAADAGDLGALAELARMRAKVGDWEAAEALARQAADADHPGALFELARMREQAGDWEGAETYARQAADAGTTSALAELAQMRAKAGDRKGAEALARQAADAGGSLPYLSTNWPYGLDPDGSPTSPWSTNTLDKRHLSPAPKP
ncbi:hypothetical protein [Kitasatospora sp. KL5]|uniref:tetratricopeptide repeat protein n=1 Tax=Kitasatospora sp. KL5 TaxID=3425125 RepID=UPI003D6E951D